MQTCLVTGASGFLGAEMARRLAAEYRVVPAGGRRSVGACRPVDLRDPGAIRSLLAEFQPDVVVHCAAYRDPDFCEEHPDDARRLNRESAREFVERLPPATRLVFISTDYVFDGRNPPYHEDSPRNPVSLYGQLKADAEDLVLRREGGLILRMPVLVGPALAGGPPGFLELMARDLQHRKPGAVDDILLRFPTAIADVAEAAAFLLRRGLQGIFHVSGARGGTRYAWTVELAQILGLPADHLHPTGTVVPRKAARPRNSALSTNRLRTLGFDHFTDFHETVRAWSAG
jgi:S-adenosylmethionine synthetase